VSLTFIRDADISFRYRIDSEAGFDFIRFSIDAVEQMTDSGIKAWQEYSQTITAGTYTLRWEYTKDGSAIGGSDGVWIDLIRTSEVEYTSLISSGSGGGGGSSEVGFTSSGGAGGSGFVIIDMQ